MQDSQGDCVWEIGRATSSPPDPVEDPEMSETVAQERHEEVERSDAVSDSDADRRQTLSRPPTLVHITNQVLLRAVALKMHSVSHWLGRYSLR